MTGLRTIALLLSSLLAGCATYASIHNQPLTSSAAAAPGYGMTHRVADGRRNDITLALAFSGGGLGLGLRAPSMLQAIDVMSDVQLHRYNAATLEQMHERLQGWAREVSTPQRHVQPWLVTVALRDVPDPAERARLSKIPSSFDLQAEEVDALVAAGRALLRNNPEFRRLLARLGAATAE